MLNVKRQTITSTLRSPHELQTANDNRHKTGLVGLEYNTSSILVLGLGLPKGARKLAFLYAPFGSNTE